MARDAASAVVGIFSSDKSDKNAVELLKADHDKVEDLFEQVKANEDGNNKDLFRKIKFELDAHAHIEETIFYPHLLRTGDEELEKIVREGIEEHRQAKMFLGELAGLSGDDDKFKAKLKVLMEDIEHHVEEEEGEMFPLVEDQVEEEKLQELGSRMEGAKAAFQGKAAQSSATA
ncbi:MAG: hemerythrin domain-containing protein [Pyrinomonadaceae bacterium]